MKRTVVLVLIAAVIFFLAGWFLNEATAKQASEPYAVVGLVEER